jgi:hypothetical protein
MTRFADRRWLAVILILASAGRFPAEQQPGGPADAALRDRLLPVMDEKLIQECMQSAAQVQAWRQTLAQLQQQLRDAQRDPESAAVHAIIAQLNQRSVIFKQQVLGGSLAEMNRQLRTWQDKGQPANLRRQAAMAVHRELEKAAGLVDAARDPASFARDFIQQKLQREFLNTAYPAGDVKFKLVQQSFTRPVFSPDADIAIEVEYAALPGFTLRARGLYFKAQGSGLPRPVFDRMKPETNIQDLAAVKLASLGENFPVGDLPVAIKNPEFKGWTGARPGGVAFKVVLDFASKFGVAEGKLKIEAGVTVGPQDAQMKLEGNLKLAIEEEIHLGTTGLMLAGGYIELDPNSKTVELGTYIATVVAKKQGICLDVSIKFSIPVREIDYKGSLKVGSTVLLARIEGKFSPEEISGKLEIPHPENSIPGMDSIAGGKGKFKLNSDGLTADAKLRFFQALTTTFDLILRTNGSGRFYASEETNLFNVFQVRSTLEVTFERGFSNLELTASFMAQVDGIDGFGMVRVAIEVKANRSGVEVSASALGQDFTFRMGSLNDDLLQKLRDEIVARLPRAVQHLLNGLKALDVFNRNSELRKTMTAFDVFSKNSEARKILADVDATLNPFHPDNPLGQAIGDVVDDIPRPRPPRPSLPSFRIDSRGLPLPSLAWWVDPPARLDADHLRLLALMHATSLVADAGDDTLQRLRQMVGAINATRMDRKPAPSIHGTDNRRYRKKTEWQAAFDRAALAPEGKTDAVVVFAVRSSGFKSTIHSDGNNDRRTGSEMKWCELQLKNLFGKTAGKPTADVRWKEPLRADYTYLPAAQLVNDAIQDLLEQYLPEVSLNGKRRFYEKKLKVKNDCDEPIRVWVQGRTRLRIDGRYQWRWVPGDLEEVDDDFAIKLTIPAKSIKEVELIDEVRIPVPKSAGGSGGSQTLKLNTPLTASRVYIWAESESGQRWVENWDDEVWLVPPNPTYENKRRYYALEMDTYTHVFRPTTGKRMFSERVVQFRNQTGDPLTVKLQYLATEDGVKRWRNLPEFTIKAGELLEPRTEFGLRVRGSQIKFTAESDRLLFDAHRTEPLFLVAESTGRRLYLGEKIGTYEHVFRQNRPGADSKK